MILYENSFHNPVSIFAAAHRVICRNRRNAPVKHDGLCNISSGIRAITLRWPRKRPSKGDGTQSRLLPTLALKLFRPAITKT
jgi:hypothetical protein